MSTNDSTGGAKPSAAVAASGVTTQAAATPAPAPAAKATPENAGKRKRLLSLIALVVVVLGIGYGVWYFLVGAHFESTDDAYVAGNVVQVTPQVAGTVIGIKADDTDIVQQGQDLVILDPSDARVALDQAEAQLAQTVREVRTVYANNGTLSANIATRQADTIRGAFGAGPRAGRLPAARGPDRVGRRVEGGAAARADRTRQREERARRVGSERPGREASSSRPTRCSTDGMSVAQHPNVLAGRRARARGLPRGRARDVAGAGLGSGRQARRCSSASASRRARR